LVEQLTRNHAVNRCTELQGTATRCTPTSSETGELQGAAPDYSKSHPEHGTNWHKLDPK
jgi:hypothetical protein